MIGGFARPFPSLGLVSSNVLDPLLKDASQFIMEFDSDAETPITSIYDRRFLNEAFIDQNLSSPANKEKYGKIGLLVLLHVPQAFTLRSTSISLHIEREAQATVSWFATFEAHHE